MSVEPTVFVVDDDANMRVAIARLMKSVSLRVEAFASAEQFLDAYHPDRPGCLILDVRMPGMGGLQLIERLRSLGVRLPVIVLTGYADVPMAVRAIKAGAFDFIEKRFPDQELLDRVQAAIQEDRESREHARKREAALRLLTTLTPREHEILERVVQGQANKTVARELDISKKTVETHRQHIMEKLQARSLTDLIRLHLYCKGDKGKP